MRCWDCCCLLPHVLLGIPMIQSTYLLTICPIPYGITMPTVDKGSIARRFRHCMSHAKYQSRKVSMPHCHGESHLSTAPHPLHLVAKVGGYFTPYVPVYNTLITHDLWKQLFDTESTDRFFTPARLSHHVRVAGVCCGLACGLPYSTYQIIPYQYIH